MSHNVAILVYPGFQLIDATGLASVFGETSRAVAQGRSDPFYAVTMVSGRGGAVVSSSGVAVQTHSAARFPASRVDTLVVAGADPEHLPAIMADPAVGRWILACAKTATRIGSVCSGAFVLAALGLLDGKRATTHWEAAEPLARKFPAVIVDADALYITDGKVCTSAGATAGIDMALAMAAKDAGAAVASQVAKRLVLYARRPGHQSQFSELLSVQAKADAPFSDLINWIGDNLTGDLGVPALAARAGFSERSFYRKFVSATGKTPARFVEVLRLDAARMLLSQGLSLKAIAARVGLSPPSRLNEAFERRFGITPALFRGMHANL